MFNELMESIREMDAIQKGKRQPSRVIEYPEIQVKQLRESIGISQEKFALMLGVSKRTVENWEQGRAKPNAQAALLIRLVARYPETMERLAAV